ncbi:Golgi reassembly stacking protein 2 [Echinococcus multilocularis]|uniref:Golgi reassembly stacking protein 2 n=1 Tax=Echinococcus multilocularis TaxID=6211 RepID=A0A087W0E0_ECHMU|nr:Golgi reassembly stacking protein 2 [Echinococcus multilocularis]
MGSASSSLDSSTAGYHILKVQEGSPGQKAGLEAFFDFIVSVGDIRLQQDNESIKDVLAKYKDTPMQLEVYSSKTQEFREVTLIPNSDWGGQGLLGLSIRYCSFKGASENVWHVLDVSPGSPAAMAGLQPFSDYIIGTDALLTDSEDLFSVVEAHNGQPLRLYVYNSSTDQCREVMLIPNLSWGGDGMLGCEIGFGYLHRIPPPPSSALNGTHAHPPLSAAATAASTSVTMPNNGLLGNQPPYQSSLPSQQPPLCNPTSPPPPPPSLPPPLLSPQFPPTEVTNGLPSHPPPAYPSVESIGGVALAPPAPLPSNLFEGITFTPPSTPPALVPLETDRHEAPVEPPPLFTIAPPVSVEAQQQMAPPAPQAPLTSIFAPPLQPPMPPQMQSSGPATAPAFSVPLIPTTNIAPPGMPPISVQMPPADLLTASSSSPPIIILSSQRTKGTDDGVAPPYPSPSKVGETEKRDQANSPSTADPFLPMTLHHGAQCAQQSHRLRRIVFTTYALVLNHSYTLPHYSTQSALWEAKLGRANTFVPALYVGEADSPPIYAVHTLAEVALKPRHVHRVAEHLRLAYESMRDDSAVLDLSRLVMPKTEVGGFWPKSLIGLYYLSLDSPQINPIWSPPSCPPHHLFQLTDQSHSSGRPLLPMQVTNIQTTGFPKEVKTVLWTFSTVIVLIITVAVIFALRMRNRVRRYLHYQPRFALEFLSSGFVVIETVTMGRGNTVQWV